MSDKEVNAQKEFEKYSEVHASSCKPTKKCAMKKKQRTKKPHVHKNFIEGRKPFIRCIQRTRENDFNKLRVNDSGHNEGSKQVNGYQGNGFLSVGT